LILTAAVVLGIAGSTARANPIASERLSFRQVPGTAHVQITWGHMEAPPEVASITRNGAALAGDWILFSGFVANTGSGLSDLEAMQFCDCDVPVGTQSYEVKGTTPWSEGEQSRVGQVTVVAELGAPPDAGVPATDLAPWDIPEPSQLQGRDCAATCGTVTEDAGTPEEDSGGATPGDMGADDPDSGQAASPDAGAGADAAGIDPTKEDEEESGCSLSGAAKTPSPGLLLALGLLALLRRRRG
jgi:MYXO-CTERM domain-containing protein